MKILIISPLSHPTPPAGYGGVERFVHNLAQQLTASGNEVLLVRKRGSKGGAYLSKNINDDKLVSCVKTAVKKFQPDIIHVNLKDPSLFNYLNILTVPVVITIHNNVRKDSSYVNIIKNSPPHFHFTAISRSLKNRIIQALKFNHVPTTQNQVVNTGYGLNLDEIQKKAKQFSRDFYLYLGVIARYKAVYHIAAAFTQIDQNLLLVGPCHAAGEIPYFNRILALSRQYPNITHYGATQTEAEKVNLIARSKGLIIATGYDKKESDCHEAFGLVMLEANALGKPVIGYAQGNIKDYIQDGVNGYKFSHTSQINSIINHLDRQNLTTACLNWAQKYDISQVSKNYLNLFTQIAKSG